MLTEVINPFRSRTTLSRGLLLNQTSFSHSLQKTTTPLDSLFRHGGCSLLLCRQWQKEHKNISIVQAYRICTDTQVGHHIYHHKIMFYKEKLKD